MTAEEKNPKGAEEKKKAPAKAAAAPKAADKKPAAKKPAAKKPVAKKPVAKKPATTAEQKKAVAKEKPAKAEAPKPAKKTVKGTPKVLRITQVRSQIGFAQKQRRVLTGLGLGRIGRTVTRFDSPTIRGMVAKITHLVSVEEMEG
jgi:large subunit ribosomal protein L30